MYHVINRQKVVLESFEEETVLINLDTGLYYSLNPSGAEVLALVTSGLAFDQVVAALASAHEGAPDAIAPSVRRLVEECVREGLLLASAEAPPEPVPVAIEAALAQGAPFEEPRLERFSDMQDLLVLDPIHEVGETGWPTKPDTR